MRCFRNCLLLFWLLNVFATLGFCARTALYVHKITTAHRKFFHVTVSFVAASGFLYDPAFAVLCGHLIIQVFILLEVSYFIIDFGRNVYLDITSQFSQTMERHSQHLSISVSWRSRLDISHFNSYSFNWRNLLAHYTGISLLFGSTLRITALLCWNLDGWSWRCASGGYWSSFWSKQVGSRSAKVDGRQCGNVCGSGEYFKKRIDINQFTISVNSASISIRSVWPYFVVRLRRLHTGRSFNASRRQYLFAYHRLFYIPLHWFALPGLIIRLCVLNVF